MNLKLGKDINGNKLLKVSFKNGTRGFSVQTNQNLPETHKMTNDALFMHLAEFELSTYVRDYGTTRQKQLFNH